VVDNKLVAIIAGVSITLAGLITSAPSVRSVLRTPVLRAVGAGLLAAALVTVGMFIARVMLHAN